MMPDATEPRNDGTPEKAKAIVPWRARSVMIIISSEDNNMMR
jgi:hypothetical protein